jgi:hypothetical protein
VGGAPWPDPVFPAITLHAIQSVAVVHTITIASGLMYAVYKSVIGISITVAVAMNGYQLSSPQSSLKNPLDMKNTGSPVSRIVNQRITCQRHSSLSPPVSL